MSRRTNTPANNTSRPQRLQRGGTSRRVTVTSVVRRQQTEAEQRQFAAAIDALVTELVRQEVGPLVNKHEQAE